MTLFFISRYTVWQAPHQNLEMMIDSNFVDLETQPKYMVKNLWAKVVTNFSKVFDLNTPHNQI